MKLNFALHKEELENQYKNINWQDGLSEKELREEFSKTEERLYKKSAALAKAECFKFIAEKSKIAVDKNDIFQEKVLSYGLMQDQRYRWEQQAMKDAGIYDEWLYIDKSRNQYGSYFAYSDYGHTSPNTELLVKVGFTGLLKRLAKKPDTEFYRSCRIVLEACIIAAKRLAAAVRPYNPDNADSLERIANGAPENIYDAMQLTVLYFFMHEYVCGTRVRTLGRVDVMFLPYYIRDLENGTFTKDEIADMLRYFLNKFWAAEVPFNLPLCIGGFDRDGNEATNELSYLIVDVFSKMDIYSPKIHVRVSEKTPADFVKKVLSSVRAGNSSFVFVCDEVCVKSLVNVGIDERDARNYVPIGCYEQAVWGSELGCTGNGGMNLAKAVELVMTNGRDFASGDKIGLETGKITTYEEFKNAVKAQIAYITEKGTEFIKKAEKLYHNVGPDPLLSAQYDDAVERGIDVYDGGAKYNNTSWCFYSIATLADSVAAVKKLVFDEKLISFDGLCELMKKNWETRPDLLAKAKKMPEKFGNDNDYVDDIAKEFSDYCSEIILGKPNARGGVFKPAIFTIDTCFLFGKNTMATPDGRLAHDPCSKNFCATAGMDKNTVTGLINSVTKIDHSKFPDGSVLDIVLHPSAVSGDDGLDAMYALLMAYKARGGYAMHGNVFNAEDLKAAQKNPEKYKNLQVRVCGWNVYFNNLTKIEQDTFIKQAECAV